MHFYHSRSTRLWLVRRSRVPRVRYFLFVFCFPICLVGKDVSLTERIESEPDRSASSEQRGNEESASSCSSDHSSLSSAAIIASERRVHTRSEAHARDSQPTPNRSDSTIRPARPRRCSSNQPAAPMSRHRTDLREVEQSPDGRYVRVSAHGKQGAGGGTRSGGGRRHGDRRPTAGWHAQQQRPPRRQDCAALRWTCSGEGRAARRATLRRMAATSSAHTARPVPAPALSFLSLQFDEKLGNGAFKEVYLSYDTETGKEVAW